ncbi:hypothetical protein PAMP_001265 [Pampus punctatissimus]
MFEPKSSSCPPSRKEERHSTPDILISESDERFFQSLYEFIEHEKQYLQCPSDGADELRYIIYRSAFNKVIARATTYKRLLMTIKVEYDDISWIFIVIKKKRLTVAESEDLEALDGHLKHLEAQKASLKDRKNHCVSLEVKAELDAKLQAAEHHRDQMNTENNRLKVLYQRLRFVFNCLSRWEEEKQDAPLEELLGSTLDKIRQTMTDDAHSINAELFEDEEPTGVDESKLLTDYLDRCSDTNTALFSLSELCGLDLNLLSLLLLSVRFIELFDSAQYEEAALLAARSPRGVLRNLDTMEMFKGVKGMPGSVPPLLLFFHALLITAPAGDELSGPLSLQVVRCALQHGASQLVTYAITQNNLSLLQLLTEPQQGPAAISSVGVACVTLLVHPQLQQLALQFLDSFISRGRGLSTDRGFEAGDPGGQQLFSGCLDRCGVSVFWAEPFRPEPGHCVRPAGPERYQSPVPRPGGSPTHGARLPVNNRTGKSCHKCIEFHLPQRNKGTSKSEHLQFPLVLNASL